MTFYKITLTGGGFQDSSGNPISYGWMEWRLSHDSNTCVLGGPVGNQIVSGLVTKVYLDGNGNALPSQIYPNDILTPDGSYYSVKAYSETGLEIWSYPQQFVLQGYVSGQTVDLGTLQPVLP